MTTFNYTNILTQAVDELSESQSYKGLFHQHKDGDPLPSAKSLYKIVELARAIIFPGYFGNSTVNSHTINYHIGVNVETLFGLLTEQILAGLCFGQENSKNATDDNEPCRETASLLAARFISKLPELRRILATDVEAAYYGDPAATCFKCRICLPMPNDYVPPKDMDLSIPPAENGTMRSKMTPLDALDGYTMYAAP
jgi:serine O-acetyltransferase